MLSFAISLQSLQPIRRWQPQILELDRGIDRIEFHECALLNIARELACKLPLENSLGVPAAKRSDHTSIVNRVFTGRQPARDQALGLRLRLIVNLVVLWQFLDNLAHRPLLFFIRMDHRFLTMGAHF